MTIAAKTFNNNMSREHFLHEATEMSKLSHKNIVEMYGVWDTNNGLYIILEYMCNGTLSDFLDKNRNILTLDYCHFISEQIACGMKYLESMNIKHGDLSMQNVLVGEDGTIKIADFGYARSKLKRNSQSSCEDCDVRSFGSVLKEFFSDRPIPKYIENLVNDCKREPMESRPSFNEISKRLRNARIKNNLLNILCLRGFYIPICLGGAIGYYPYNAY